VRQLAAAGIEEAWSDLQQLPTPWNASPGAPSREHTPGIVEFGELDDEISDDLPAAVPFRTVAADDALLQLTPQNNETLGRRQPPETIVGQEEEFQPAGSIRPEVEIQFEPTANPFHEAFDEEEVVLDPYTTIETDALADRPLVYSDEGRELGALLSPLSETDKEARTIAPTPWAAGLPTDQHSIISAGEIQGETAAAGMTPIEITPWELPLPNGQPIDMPAAYLSPGDMSQIDFGGENSPDNESSDSASQSIADRITAPQVPQARRTDKSASIPPVPVTRLPDGLGSQSDADLIVIDESVPPRATLAPKNQPMRRRQEFRQLFARLRRE
jgi:hypothetical protein